MTYSSVISDELHEHSQAAAFSFHEFNWNVGPRNETDFDISGWQMETKQISPDADGFVSFNLIPMYLLVLEYRTAQ